MRTDELDYDLPQELIATEPANPRDAARLLVFDKRRPDDIEHRIVRDLPDLLAPGDVLVFNDSRVLPARFRGFNEATKGRVEGLWLRDDSSLEPEGLRWICLVKARRFRTGDVIRLRDRGGLPSPFRLVLIEREDSEPGAWRAKVEHDGPAEVGEPTPGILDRVGLTALPPYIRSARKAAGMEGNEEADRAGYQTVYARGDAGDDGGRAPTLGSVAAPTAGLHFTPELLARLDERGVRRVTVTLHVAGGTFRPIETEEVERHPIHAEWCRMSGEALRAVFGTGEAGRVICVGTTSVRTVESYAAAVEEAGPEGAPGWLETRLLISPGYRWRRVDGMLTNFHLPRSSLLALVAAAVDGIDRARTLYEEAVRERYRFYSFGDAMLVV